MSPELISNSSFHFKVLISQAEENEPKPVEIRPFLPGKIVPLVSQSGSDVKSKSNESKTYNCACKIQKFVFRVWYEFKSSRTRTQKS